MAKPAPGPVARTSPPGPLAPGTRPDGSRPAERAVDAALEARFHVSSRLLSMHGHTWLAVRELLPDEVAEILAVLDDDAIGIHVDHLGRAPGIGAWIGSPLLASRRYLSFNSAFLRGDGLQWLYDAGTLANAEILDLSVCDIGSAGLKLLNQADLPALRELYLGANDSDRTKWDAKAVATLLADTPRKPMGSALRDLRVLGLLFWHLGDAMGALAASPVIQGLERLWISDQYYAKYRNVSNVAALPDSLKAITVVGWEQRPAS